MGFISDLITNVSAFRIKIGEKLLILKAAINLKANIDGSNIPPQTQWANLHAGGLDGYVFHGGQVGSNFENVFVETNGGIFQTNVGGFRTWVGIGKMSDLTTTHKTTIVGAINEVSNNSNNKKEDAYIHSYRDFADGTLIETDIDYSQAVGEEIELEIKGNSYNAIMPLFARIQCYIWNNTLINCVGFSTYEEFNSIAAFNLNGKLHFWFPRLGYWQGFSVKVNAADGNGGLPKGKQRVISIINSVDPGGTKRVIIPIVILASRNWTNDWFAKQNGYYPNLNVGKSDNSNYWKGARNYSYAGAVPVGAIEGVMVKEIGNNDIYVSDKNSMIYWLGINVISNTLGNKANVDGSNTTGGSWSIDYILSPVLQGAIGNAQVIYPRADGVIEYGSMNVVRHTFDLSSPNSLTVNLSGVGLGTVWHEFNFNPDNYLPKSYGTTSSIAAYYRNASIPPAGSRIKIRLPYTITSYVMIAFTIRVYQNYRHSDIAISGYFYSGPNIWYEPSARFIVSHGNAWQVPIDVIFGYDADGKAYVSIPMSNYIGIAILDVVLGFAYGNNPGAGWEIIPDNSTPNVTITQTIEPLNRVGQLTNDVQYTTKTYVDQEIQQIALTPGPQGIQGLQGPQGPPGAGLPNPGVEVLNFTAGAHVIDNQLAITIVRCTSPGTYTFDLQPGKYDGDEICITTCGYEYNVGGELLSMCGTSGFGSSTASRWIWADQLAKWVQVG